MNHRPRKRFGQNFLIDPFVIDRILTAIDAGADDRLVEIGPGRGALTQGLAARAGHLALIEIDRDLVSVLERQFDDNPRVTVISDDALNVDFAALGESLRVVGNLPYNISTPLLFHLAQYAAHLRDMHFMLQREVVNRMVAGPGSKAYGRLSVMLQSRFDAELLFEVAPDAFEPQPKVHSAIVRLQPADDPPQIDDPARFAALVTQAFSQRRKTLRNALQSMADETQMAAVGIDPRARAETLSVAQFAALANRLSIE